MPKLKQAEKDIDLPSANLPLETDCLPATDSDTAPPSCKIIQQIEELQPLLDKIKQDRALAVERVSDTLAYLYSPATFRSEVMALTAKKLGLEAESENIPLESLAECFSNFAGSQPYPAIAASSALGCLPM